MDITRESILNLKKEEKLVTIDQLIKFLDYKEFKELVFKYAEELEDGIMKFRYDDRIRCEENYKERLYKELKEKGYKLDKKKCLPHLYNKKPIYCRFCDNKLGLENKDTGEIIFDNKKVYRVFKGSREVLATCDKCNEQNEFYGFIKD